MRLAMLSNSGGLLFIGSMAGCASAPASATSRPPTEAQHAPAGSRNATQLCTACSQFA